MGVRLLSVSVQGQVDKEWLPSTTRVLPVPIDMLDEIQNVVLSTRAPRSRYRYYELHLRRYMGRIARTPLLVRSKGIAHAIGEEALIKINGTWRGCTVDVPDKSDKVAEKAKKEAGYKLRQKMRQPTVWKRVLDD